MKFTPLKAIILIAFIFLTVSLTYFGINSNKANIDFDALEKAKSEKTNIKNQNDFENILKNIGSSTSLVKPDILQSRDTNRLSLSIQLLDTMKQYIYAGILSENLAKIQNNSNRFHKAARYYLLATENHENELMFFKKAKLNLEKCLELEPNNLDAKVDLAVCFYNLHNMQAPENQMELMKPALLLREVVKADSNHIDGLYYLGKMAIETNQTEKAIARFKKLVSLQPQNQAFYLELSKIYLSIGKNKEAKAWEDKAQAIK